MNWIIRWMEWPSGSVWLTTRRERELQGVLSPSQVNAYSQLPWDAWFTLLPFIETRGGGCNHGKLMSSFVFKIYISGSIVFSIHVPQINFLIRAAMLTQTRGGGYFSAASVLQSVFDCDVSHININFSLHFPTQHTHRHTHTHTQVDHVSVMQSADLQLLHWTVSFTAAV